MKKIFNTIMSILLTATVFFSTSCVKPSDDINPNPDDNKELVMIKQSDDVISISNENLKLTFDKESGNLTSLYNVKTNTENLKGTNSGNFTLYIDTSTSDMWTSKPPQFAQCQPDGDVNRPSSYPEVSEAIAMVSSREQSISSIKVKDIENGKEINFYYDIYFQHGSKVFTGIEVTAAVSLTKGDNKSMWRYEITNNCEGATITQFVTAQLENIDEDNDYSLFWPMHEGELHESAITLAKDSELVTSVDGFAADGTKFLIEEYPSHLSMSLVQLYNDEQSVFYYVTDDSGEYKQFNFGILNGENHYDYGTTDSISLSATQYPFIEPTGITKTLKPVYVGVSSKGGWYEGSDEYRNWLLTTDVRSKSYMDIAKNLTGYAGLTFKLINDIQPSIGFDTMLSGGNIASNVAKFDGMGIDSIFCLGWMDEGFDSKYPDYKINAAMGGEQGLKDGITRAHNNGDQVIMYINLFSATEDSEWFNKSVNGVSQGHLAKIKSAYGGDYAFTYSGNGTQTKFYSVCPYSQYYVNAIDEAVTKMARCGADGIFFDQLMEMPANLCFDKTHGHSTPATAYGEGYEKLFSYIKTAMDSYSDNYFFSCEGVNDAYLKYVDIPGLMWDRYYGWSDYTAPNTIRYTLPTKIMGLPTFGTGGGTMATYAMAYVMGEPLRVSNDYNNQYAKMFTDAYKEYPEIFFNGRYYDKTGLTCSDEAFVGIMASDDSMVLSVFNNSASDIEEYEIIIDVSKIFGQGKSINSIIDTFNKEAVSFENNRLTIALNAGNLKSFKIDIK